MRRMIEVLVSFHKRLANASRVGEILEDDRMGSILCVKCPLYFVGAR
jgi:hypothetical protein